MKSHILTIVLLLFAAVAFGLRFILNPNYSSYCDIAAFALPSLAAIVEIIISERSGKKINDELSKRPVWITLSQEEYDKLKQEGKFEKDTFYATIE